MAVDLGSVALNAQERSSRVTRVTPAEGNYRLIIEREQVLRDGSGNIIARSPVPSVEIQVNNLLASPSPASLAYLAACQKATSLLELMAAEAAWYDGLNAEAKAASGG